MGQIFCACAYDTDTFTSCVMDADKFHANCYSFSGVVLAIHYLLRQKPYRVMWGGDYMAIDDALEYCSRTEDLLGISTYLTYEDFELNNPELDSKDYFDKVKFIDENSKRWKEFHVIDEAREYFNWDETHSVEYKGYLLNHTKKMAVDLEDYFKRSRGFTQKGDRIAIDLVPVLTETGGGTLMAILDGVQIDSTEQLDGEWCGDLLQITDDLPDGFQLIDCCLAEAYSRIRYCHVKFGVDKNGYLLGDDTGKLYEAVPLTFYGKRGHSNIFKVEHGGGIINFIPEVKT